MNLDGKQNFMIILSEMRKSISKFEIIYEIIHKKGMRINFIRGSSGGDNVLIG
jgi:hypothetical protein